MKILFFGDIFGRPGREGIQQALPRLKKKYKPDVTIANVENLAHGRGVTRRTIEEVSDAGVNIFTSGNHIWDNKEGIEVLDDSQVSLLRPANYPPGLPGRGVLSVDVRGKKLLVINLLGRVFMKTVPDCPFRKIDEILKKYAKGTAVILVDFHAETTSEKRAFGWHVDGRVSAVLGTHTHIPTADLEILPQGTAYITDIGMVGPHNSVIGADTKFALPNYLNQLPMKIEIANEGPVEINGVFLEIDNNSGKAIKTLQIREILDM